MIKELAIWELINSSVSFYLCYLDYSFSYLLDFFVSFATNTMAIEQLMISYRLKLSFDFSNLLNFRCHAGFESSLGDLVGQCL